MKLNWKCNQKEQIIRGIDPRESAEVDVDLSALTPEQRILVAEGWQGTLVEMTATEIADGLAAEVAARKQKADDAQAALVERDCQARLDIEAAVLSTQTYSAIEHGVRVE